MGPPIVGWLYDALGIGSYKVAFVLVELVGFISGDGVLADAGEAAGDGGQEEGGGGRAPGRTQRERFKPAVAP